MKIDKRIETHKPFIVKGFYEHDYEPFKQAIKYQS